MEVKKKLKEEGKSHLDILVQYLHSDFPVVQRLDFDEDELQLARSLDHAVDLDKYFVEQTLGPNKVEEIKKLTRQLQEARRAERIQDNEVLSENG